MPRWAQCARHASRYAGLVQCRNAKEDSRKGLVRRPGKPLTSEFGLVNLCACIDHREAYNNVLSPVTCTRYCLETCNARNATRQTARLGIMPRVDVDGLKVPGTVPCARSAGDCRKPTVVLPHHAGPPVEEGGIHIVGM